MAKGLGITWKLYMAYCPPEFRESRMDEQDSKIAIGKTMPGNPPTIGSITAHRLVQD
jgi:hypothetical protein